MRKEVIESPYGDGNGRILKIIQWNTTISVLYTWINEDKNQLAGGTLDTDPRFKLRTLRAARKMREPHRSRFSSIPSPMSSPSPSRSHSRSSESEDRSYAEKPEEYRSPRRFHLLHYNAYAFSKPIILSIPRFKEHLVPVSFAVSGRLRCAILWDLEGSIRPTSEVAVVLYTADHAPRGEEGTYDARQIGPSMADTTRDGDDSAVMRPVQFDIFRRASRCSTMGTDLRFMQQDNLSHMRSCRRTAQHPARCQIASCSVAPAICGRSNVHSGVTMRPTLRKWIDTMKTMGRSRASGLIASTPTFAWVHR